MPIVRKITPPKHDDSPGPPPSFPPLTRADICAWGGESQTFDCW
jgi:hypothetical protein